MPFADWLRRSPTVSPARVLAVGDRIRVTAGYDQEPPWLDGGTGYVGTVAAFIPGQNANPAAVVRFDNEIVLPQARGQFAVLELGHTGTNWSTPQPRIHVELCETQPPPIVWSDRSQGAWVESHATYLHLT